MHKNRLLSFGIVSGLALTLVACQSTNRREPGGNRAVPDEFKIVTKAPLVIPPDYNLRPPRPGESRPQELQTSEVARTVVFGERYGTEASEGERLLIAAADATSTDPNIRQMIDYEAANTTRRRTAFADRILFAEANEGTPLDAEEEANRLKEQKAIEGATGGAPVVIERGNRGAKLPGL